MGTLSNGDVRWTNFIENYFDRTTFIVNMILMASSTVKVL